MFICLRPLPLLGFCLHGLSRSFVSSESGQIQSVQLLQNMVSNRACSAKMTPSEASHLIAFLPVFLAISLELQIFLSTCMCLSFLHEPTCMLLPDNDISCQYIYQTFCILFALSCLIPQCCLSLRLLCLPVILSTCLSTCPYCTDCPACLLN